MYRRHFATALLHLHVASPPPTSQESLDSPIDRRSDYYRQQALLQTLKEQVGRPGGVFAAACSAWGIALLLAGETSTRPQPPTPPSSPSAANPTQGKLKPQPLLTPPNVLTFARVALVPLFMLLWHAAHQYASIATAAVFIAASITDWLDGYLARRVGPQGGGGAC